MFQLSATNIEPLLNRVGDHFQLPHPHVWTKT